jgi:cohesin complex subunit SA-1/2
MAEAARGKTARFRAGFSRVWHELARACREGSGHNLEALAAVIELLRALCGSPLVSIRHTATYGGLQVANALVKETLELSRKEGVASRQLEAEHSKGAGRSRKAQDLQASIEQLTGGVAALETVLEEIFNDIFAQRYRDVHERVRVDCMEGLGYFLGSYPSMFLKDSFIKYLGWMLHDKVGCCCVMCDATRRDVTRPGLTGVD